MAWESVHLTFSRLLLYGYEPLPLILPDLLAHASVAWEKRGENLYIIYKLYNSQYPCSVNLQKMVGTRPVILSHLELNSECQELSPNYYLIISAGRARHQHFKLLGLRTT